MKILLYLKLNKDEQVIGASAMPSGMQSNDGTLCAVPVSTDKDMGGIKELAKQGLTLQEFLAEVNNVKTKKWKKDMIKNRLNQKVKDKDEIKLTEREIQRISNLYGGY